MKPEKKTPEEEKKRLLKLPMPKAIILFRQIKSLMFLNQIITFLNRKITKTQ